MRRKLQVKTLILGVIGGIVLGSSIGVVATNYLLKAEDVEYKNNKNLQDAIDELYGMASNQKGGTEPLSITTSVSGSNIELTYTGTYTDIKCLYGLNDTYGSLGTISGNNCIISGLPDKTYNYKIIASNNDGKIYEGDGFIKTNAGATVITTGIPTGTLAIVYMDPSNLGNSCNASNSVSTTGTKTGCMKWYAYKSISENNIEKYKMILDHNTTQSVQWHKPYGYVMGYSSGEIGYELNQLVSTSGWALSPYVITYAELLEIASSSSGSNSGINALKNTNSSGAYEFLWLFDRMSGSADFGGTNDSSGRQYWVSAERESRQYYLAHGGYITDYGTEGNCGLRPVITISKEDLGI